MARAKPKQKQKYDGKHRWGDPVPHPKTKRGQRRVASAALRARFVTEYLVDLNASAAYRRCRPNVKERSAQIMGFDLVNDPEVAAEIQKAMDARAKRTEITQDRVLQELAKLAFVDVTQVFDEDGLLRPLKELGADLRATIAGMDVVKRKEPGDAGALEYTHKLKFWSKLDALDKLGRHLKLFTDKHEHTGPNGKPLVPEQMSDLELARRVAFILNSAVESNQKPTT